MEQVLRQERAKSNIDTKILTKLLYGNEQNMIKTSLEKLQKKVTLDANIYNQGRIHMIKDTFKLLPSLLTAIDPKEPGTLTAGVLYMQNQFPGSVHMTMWLICLDLMASDKQYSEYYHKSLTGQVIGCYAQTQLGHGSDIQSLQTTATLDKSTDQFVLNTPSLSATKFWPGDLGIFSNYAAVFARVIVDGNFLGVFPIIARIRDNDHKPMPGIECGDIGPKVGYITKDNGYLIFNNVRVPRTNLLSKLVDISPQGQIQMKGDPKVLYASMMITRKLIINVFPKLYTNALTIATRYSLFRKMFKDDRGHEITIIQYQTQQDKILPLIADYFAFSIDGNKICDLTDENFKRVTTKGDPSLLAQCHASLCYSKAFYTDNIEIGMQILRRACGGHGFSHYSGMPNLVQQFYAHPVHQGQNTVLYLQVSRYILKNYKKFSEKKEKSKILDSILYLKDFDHFKNYKTSIQANDPSLWTGNQILNILSHNVCYNINLIIERQNQFKEIGSKAIQNTKNGLILRDLAKAHGFYNTFKSFFQSIPAIRHEATRSAILNLCLLYGINHLILDPLSVISSGCLSVSHITSLKQKKQQILKQLRPNLVSLVDSFIVSEKGLKSALTYGNVYKNMLELARKSPLNNEIPESVWKIKRQLTNTRPRL